MYQNPSIHFELAKQRQADLLREARANQLSALAGADPKVEALRQGADSLKQRLFTFLHRRPVTRQARFSPAS